MSTHAAAVRSDAVVTPPTRGQARQPRAPPGAVVCCRLRRVLQLLDLPRSTSASVRPRARRRPIPDRLCHGRLDADWRVPEAAGRRALRSVRTAAIARCGALVFATLPFSYLAVSTLAWLVVLRFLHGSATAIFGPVASASLSDIAPAARRGAWLRTYSTAQGAGQAIGPILAGYAIAAGRFDLAFVVSGLIGLGAPLIVGTWRGGPAGTSTRPSWQAFKHGVSEVVSDRLVLITSAAHAAQFVLNGMLNAFLPLYGREVLNLSGSELGWLFGMQAVTTLMVRPVIGVVSDRVGRRAVIVTGLTICSLAVFSLSLTTTLTTVVVVVLTYAAVSRLRRRRRAPTSPTSRAVLDTAPLTVCLARFTTSVMRLGHRRGRARGMAWIRAHVPGHGGCRHRDGYRVRGWHGEAAVSRVTRAHPEPSRFQSREVAD